MALLALRDVPANQRRTAAGIARSVVARVCPHDNSGQNSIISSLLRLQPAAAFCSRCLLVQDYSQCLTVESMVEEFIPVGGMALRQSSRSTSALGLLSSEQKSYLCCWFLLTSAGLCGNRYAQCWIVAGVTVTLLRVLGIPSRPVTCYEAAHQTKQLGEVNYFFSPEGNLLHELAVDSVW